MEIIIMLNTAGLILALGTIGYFIYLIATKKILKLFKLTCKKIDLRPEEKRWLQIEDTTEEVVYLCEDGTEYHFKKFKE